jgi:DNA modification methylase
MDTGSNTSSSKRPTVASRRKYNVLNVAQAKEIAVNWLMEVDLHNAVRLGLPEVDDRYHFWRVPLCSFNGERVGEAVIDAYTTELLPAKTTHPDVLTARLLKQDETKITSRKKPAQYRRSYLRNTIGFGDCADLMEEMPTECVDLIFTSPPYFNARPEYSDYEEYDHYLFKMRQVIRLCHRVLSEGRFFVMNIAPVLLRRASRNEASRRIAVPFDFHRIFVEEGFDFIDDIIWLKPEGAGWATGRGRRFAADRNPLQYKAVPVTEYVLVYRKRTDLLIDWHIRNHPDKDIIDASKVPDGYERTNVWRINPATGSKHPAAFPRELAEKVIRYYSFIDDVVMDPFAGSGTVGDAATRLKRRFVLYENNPDYIELMKEAIFGWPDVNPSTLMWLNCNPPQPRQPRLLDKDHDDYQ